MIDHRERQAAGNGGTQQAKGGRGKGGLRRRCRSRKDAVCAGDGMISADAGVSLSGVLRCQQVVGYRDDRKQEEDEDGESDELLAPADTGLGSKAVREAQDRGRQQHPREIEAQLHVQPDFTSTWLPLGWWLGCWSLFDWTLSGDDLVGIGLPEMGLWPEPPPRV